MKKLNRSKLALSHTTIRNLSADALKRVAGGLSKNGCNSMDLICPGGTDGVCGLTEYPCGSGFGSGCQPTM